MAERVTVTLICDAHGEDDKGKRPTTCKGEVERAKFVGADGKPRVVDLCFSEFSKLTEALLLLSNGAIDEQAIEEQEQAQAMLLKEAYERGKAEGLAEGKGKPKGKSGGTATADKPYAPLILAAKEWHHEAFGKGIPGNPSENNDAVKQFQSVPKGLAWKGWTPGMPTPVQLQDKTWVPATTPNAAEAVAPASPPPLAFSAG